VDALYVGGAEGVTVHALVDYLRTHLSAAADEASNGTATMTIDWNTVWQTSADTDPVIYRTRQEPAVLPNR